MRPFTFISLLASLIALTISASAFCATDSKQLQQLTMTDPAQFLVAVETIDMAAIVNVKQTELRWVVLPHGDNISLYVANVEMNQVLSGGDGWPAGAQGTVMQYDYSDLISEPISPPAIENRRYLLFAFKTPKNSEVPSLASLVAYPQGFLLVRGELGAEFVYWNGRSYSIAAIQSALKTRKRLPLDQIIDPVRRLKVAEARMNDGDLGDPKAFVRGLLLNLVDPEGQAKKVERNIKSAGENDMFGMNRDAGQPHGLWYNSLARLRDLGKDEVRRVEVIEALKPVVKTARQPVRLATALALVDLGNDAGRDALIKGFESESGPISSDPSDKMTYPGRYPYDESSITACAHALARLGDRRGLNHPKPEVRLAAAVALVDRPDADLQGALKSLATELEPRAEALRASGELTKLRRTGDYTNRYPAHWVRTLQLLARIGDDVAFRQLVEAYLADADTYPKDETLLMPRAQVASWTSNGLSPGRGIRDSNKNSPEVVERLRRLFGQDSRWEKSSFKILRESLSETEQSTTTEPSRPKPPEESIGALLRSADADKRAEGLAAAGYHGMGIFYDTVLEAAVSRKGVEKNAAIYSLGLFGRDVPETTLRQLIADEDLGVRFNAIELATRKNPGRFALEAMKFVRAKTVQAKDAKPDNWEIQREMAYLPRVLSRLARGPIPQPMLAGLKDPDPTVRRIVIQAFELSGNPDSVKYIQAIARPDADAETLKSSQQAIRIIGPM